MFEERKFNKFRGSGLGNLQSDPYDEKIYGILQQFNLDVLRQEESGAVKPIFNISLQEFTDELFLALRTLYNAAIGIDSQNNIEVRFSEKCVFKIHISDY